MNRSIARFLFVFLLGCLPHEAEALPTKTNDAALTKTLVHGFVDMYVPYLRSQLEPYKKQFPHYAIHKDPLACRLCFVASDLLLEDLTNHFPRIRWIIRDTKGSYGGFAHTYLYSPDLDLIVDPTYRQFLVERMPENFDLLPKIFVGTPAEFKVLMGKFMPKKFISFYLGRAYEKLPESPYISGYRRTKKFKLP